MRLRVNDGENDLVLDGHETLLSVLRDAFASPERSGCREENAELVPCSWPAGPHTAVCCRL
jgi:hypothetical protein